MPVFDLYLESGPRRKKTMVHVPQLLGCVAAGPTTDERNEPFVHWQYTRTGRKVLRRMLEHQWEHLVEIQERLAGN